MSVMFMFKLQIANKLTDDAVLLLVSMHSVAVTYWKHYPIVYIFLRGVPYSPEFM